VDWGGQPAGLLQGSVVALQHCSTVLQLKLESVIIIKAKWCKLGVLLSERQ
jgi:hypothetical protein